MRCFTSHMKHIRRYTAKYSGARLLFTSGGMWRRHGLRVGVGHFPFDIPDRLARRVESRIADALVIDVNQRVDETFADRCQFSHGDGAFVELAVSSHAVNDLFDNR